MFSVIGNSLNLDAVKLDSLYLVKLTFGEYFCYFDSNRILLQLQLYLDANRVLVRERGNIHVKKKKKKHDTNIKQTCLRKPTTGIFGRHDYVVLVDTCGWA